MNLGFFLSPASSQGYFSCMYQKHHHIWRNGKLPDAAIDVFLTALCWETSRLIHSPLAPRHVFVTTANLSQPSSSGCHILDSLSQRARKRLADSLLLVSYQSMWGLLWHCLRLLPGMQEICVLLKHPWDQSTPQVGIYSRTYVGRAGFNTLSMTLWLFSLLPDLQKSLPVSVPGDSTYWSIIYSLGTYTDTKNLDLDAVKI